MSGGEPSSIKQSPQCAARAPVLSRRCEDRVGATFDLEVYGLVLQLSTVFVRNLKGQSLAFFIFDRSNSRRWGFPNGEKGGTYASGVIP